MPPISLYFLADPRAIILRTLRGGRIALRIVEASVSRPTLMSQERPTVVYARPPLPEAVPRNSQVTLR